MQIKNVQQLADYLCFCLEGDTTPEKLVELINDYQQIEAMEEWFGINNN